MAWDHVPVEDNAPDYRNAKSAAELILAQDKDIRRKKRSQAAPGAAGCARCAALRRKEGLSVNEEHSQHHQDWRER